MDEYYDSLTKRKTLSNQSETGKKSFRASLFGFNRESVIYYVDTLCRDAAEQERRFVDTIKKLTNKNGELTRAISEYERKITLIKAELDNQVAYCEDVARREDSFKQSVGILQSQVNELQNNLARERADKFDAIQKMQSEQATARKYMEQAQYLNNEMARRNSIYMQMGAELNKKNTEANAMRSQLSMQNNALNAQNAAIKARDSAIYELRQKVGYLEQKITEINNRRLTLETMLRDTTPMQSMTPPRQAALQPEENAIFINFDQIHNETGQMEKDLNSIGSALNEFNSVFGTANQQMNYAQPPMQSEDIGYFQNERQPERQSGDYYQNAHDNANFRQEYNHGFDYGGGQSFPDQNFFEGVPAQRQEMSQNPQQPGANKKTS